MKSLILYNHAHDAGVSAAMASALAGLGLSPEVVDYYSPARKHDAISSLPALVIDVDGMQYAFFSAPGFSAAAVKEAWDAAPSAISAPPPLEVVIETKRLVDSAWVSEESKFVEGEPIRVEARIVITGTDTTYTGAGSDASFLVPLYRGQLVAGAVQPTSIDVAILDMHFVSGVADPVVVSVAESMWICAVPGLSSTWIKTPVIRAITKALVEV